jgi:glc operon protein GlcG
MRVISSFVRLIVQTAILGLMAFPAAAGIEPQENAGAGQEGGSLLLPLQGLPPPAQQIGPRRSPPELTTVPSDVRDQAGLFSKEAIHSARETLGRIEKTLGAPILIETIESLEGENIDAVAIRLARRSGSQGIFVLIAKKEAKLEVLPSRPYLEALPRGERDKVRAAFIEPFRGRDFDEGLRKGVAALDAELKRAAKEGKLPQAEKASFEEEMRKRGFMPATVGATAGVTDASAHSVEGAAGPLVRRGRVQLTLEGARTIIAAAARRAASMKLKVNIAVVDDGGHLLSFDRMDEARPASGYTAITKATTAATFRQPTGPLPAGTASPDLLLNLSLPLAAQASGGKITTLHGGIPVIVDEQVIGGVGVGGGTGEQDATVARAGVQALVDSLKREGAATPSAERR